jgi:hypothetical protein
MYINWSLLKHILHSDNWRIFFFIHAGILGACFLAVLLILPEYHRPYVNIVSQIDFLGSGLIMISLVMLFYVLSAAPDASKGWGTPCKPSEREDLIQQFSYEYIVFRYRRPPDSVFCGYGTIHSVAAIPAHACLSSG